MINHPLLPKLSEIPSLPGCYIYRDEEGKILYIGKAKILKNRVRSYFSNYANLENRIQLMIDRARSIETHIVESEIEALILEANLIRKYKPPYNADLKDDKKYAWIKITTKDEFPAIFKTREFVNDGNKYFGPYPSGVMRNSLLKFLRKQFPFRTCNLKISEEGNTKFFEQKKLFEEHAKMNALGISEDIKISENKIKPPKSRICMFYHLGLCTAPCDSLIIKKEYRKQINNIVRFLSGRKKDLYENLKKEMNFASKNEQFERAAKIRDQIDNLGYFMQRVRVEYGDDEFVVKELNNVRAHEGEDELITAINKKLEDKLTQTKDNDINLEHIGEIVTEVKFYNEENGIRNFRIECYDISNIQGKYAVGSMIVFENGMPKKSDYRKFKIQGPETPNDYKMMQEVLGRRLKYLVPSAVVDAEKDDITILEQKKKNSFYSKPDLIIIDGGKGQLSAAQKIIDEMGINILCVGLAKRIEEIFLPKDVKPIVFKDNSQAKFLIQRVRDEAHRFAITYHRLLRSKGMVQDKKAKLRSKAHEKQWK